MNRDGGRSDVPDVPDAWVRRDGQRNITYEDRRAADENGRTVAETVAIMERTEARTASHPRRVRDL